MTSSYPPAATGGTRVALVTAAGSGMGAACAREFVAQGWKVIVMSSSGRGEALGRELGGIGITGSVLDAADLQRAVQAALDAHGRIDAAVCSAPHPPKGKLLDIPDADWHKGLDVILLPVIRMARLLVPVMQAQGGGSIVNISTYAALEPDPLFPVSGTLRAALAHFAKLFSDQHAGAGIRMNNLLPGFIDSLPETTERRARIPMGRYGRVDEIARTAVFLSGEGAGYITGQNLRVDGGLTRHV
jgi:NAD(P)-dependent dehydrogenase (short-subunit alcohol dehydrogenase family)